jgi:YD repeat-containing protein
LAALRKVEGVIGGPSTELGPEGRSQRNLGRKSRQLRGLIKWKFTVAERRIGLFCRCCNIYGATMCLRKLKADETRSGSRSFGRGGLLGLVTAYYNARGQLINYLLRQRVWALKYDQDLQRLITTGDPDV